MPCHVTGPVTLPPAFAKLSGTGKARPLRNISSLPESGTVVLKVFVPASYEVVAQLTVGSKVTCAFGAATVYVWSAVKLNARIAEKYFGAGIPLAVKIGVEPNEAAAVDGHSIEMGYIHGLGGAFGPRTRSRRNGAGMPRSRR